LSDGFGKPHRECRIGIRVCTAANLRASDVHRDRLLLVGAMMFAVRSYRRVVIEKVKSTLTQTIRSIRIDRVVIVNY
jgi:hypothetical protein